MTKLKKNFRTLPFVVVCMLVLGCAAALAQRQFTSVESGRPEVKVSLAGLVERNKEAIPVGKAAAVNPGETINWTITSENDGNAPAREYKTVGQIPKGTTFVAGSATAEGSTTVVYSIDNGQTYSVQPMVEEKQADGSNKPVPAPISMYTQVRYEWADPLAANSKLSATYKVRVK
ncbi:MAG TPA: hypothetical protein VGN95_06870 [Pyrinomonadaceae bacterium]|jgi:uncharacterized repeat protein (TIGR01451 family)|nr:hypothetical protein [Pyrinomonadaceae bacterium]